MYTQISNYYSTLHPAHMTRASTIITVMIVLVAARNALLPLRAAHRGDRRPVSTGGTPGGICRVWQQRAAGHAEAGFWSVWRPANDSSGGTTCTPFDGVWPSAEQYAAYEPTDSMPVPPALGLPAGNDPCGPLAVVFAVRRVTAEMSVASCGRCTGSHCERHGGRSNLLAGVRYLDGWIVRLQQPTGRLYTHQELRYVWDKVCTRARNASPPALRDICK